MSSRAVQVSRTGGPEVFEVVEVELGGPGPGELAVDVTAAGVNFIEVYFREGRYPRPLPYVPGGEGAGVVTALGSDVHGFAVGDVVAWAGGSRGSFAERTLVAADQAVPVPAGLDPALAAAVMLQGMTAHYLVTSTYPVGPGDVALVHAAAGGVGQLLVQMLKTRGATVVATVSTEAKAAIARDRGADSVLLYDPVPDAAELAGRIRTAGGGHGVDVAYDGVGAATFEATLAAMARRGTIALFGASSGPVPPFDLQRLNPAGSLFVTRPTLGDHTATREELLYRAGDVLDAVADGSLDVQIGGRYALDDVPRAFEDLEGRTTTGKLLVVP
ncbi:quinone oxidoreductase family protein [Jatrophihabitans sp. YIM 134969]